MCLQPYRVRSRATGNAGRPIKCVDKGMQSHRHGWIEKRSSEYREKVCRSYAMYGLEVSGGTWYTLEIGTVAMRLEAVFTGLESLTAPLSMRAFDGRTPALASRAEVRYT